MAAGRDLPFPGVIVCLLLITGCSSLPTTYVPPSPDALLPKGDDLFTEDYGQLEDVTSTPPVTASTRRKALQRCDYSPCVETQVSCIEMAASDGCLCPGHTLDNEVPEPPSLKSVTWNGTEVVIRWCAPYSYVTSYAVTVGGQERGTFARGRRSGGVGAIEHIAEVCLTAVNSRGASEESCVMYHPRDDSLPLKAGLIGGALGFLLLLLLAVLLWRHKRQRK